jgi:hypothetical protein
MTVFITFVLDETGSMQSVKEETINGFNQYLLDLNKDLTDVVFSLLKFDSQEMNWVHKGVPISEVNELTAETYVPRSATPLWDAFGLAITEMEEVARREDDKVIISVLTDGFENASKKFTVEQVKGLVEKHPDWAINFLGADMDAWGDVGKNISMTRGQTFSYDGSGEGVTMAFNAMSKGTTAFAQGTITVSDFYEGSLTTEEEE